MISQKMLDALNEQINAEMYSGYLYLAMSAYFTDANLNGFANWMRIQAQEELMHAMKIYDYVNEREGRILLKPIQGPKTEWSTPVEAFEETYKHEQHVTSLINNLVSLAMEEKDYATNSFLQWFVDEQVEEEANASELVNRLKMVAESRGGLFMLDRELAGRTFTAETDSE
jgi:ferritin